MINEKKLIEELLHNDGMEFSVKIDPSTPEGVGTAFQEFINKMKEGFINLINAQPTVDAVEVVHGRWEKHTVAGYDYFGCPALITLSCNCSVCGYDNRNETPYCPNCGAKMDGEP